MSLNFVAALAEQIVRKNPQGFRRVNPKSPYYEVHGDASRVLFNPKDTEFPCTLYTPNLPHGRAIHKSEKASQVMARLHKNFIKMTKKNSPGSLS